MGSNPIGGATHPDLLDARKVQLKKLGFFVADRIHDQLYRPRGVPLPAGSPHANGNTEKMRNPAARRCFRRAEYGIIKETKPGQEERQC